jgi:hypothetical protein
VVSRIRTYRLFYFQNLTQGTAIRPSEPMPWGMSKFSGDTAEWIMERQTSAVPRFWSVSMDSAWAGNCCNIGNTPFVQYNMYFWRDLQVDTFQTGGESMQWQFVPSQ